MKDHSSLAYKKISKQYFVDIHFQFLLTLIEYILVQLTQVFEPTVLLEFLLDTLDSTAVLSSLHVAPKLCKYKEITQMISNVMQCI